MKYSVITIAIGLLIGCSMIAQPKASSLDSAAQAASNTILQKPAPAVAFDLGDGVKLELVLIPAGTFTMGEKDDRDAKPAHKVIIAKPFYLGKYGGVLGSLNECEKRRVFPKHPSLWRKTVEM